MRSRGEVRRAIEWLLRAALVAGLGLALWRSLHVPAATPARLSARTAELPAALREATTTSRVDGLSVQVDSIPDRGAREWLGALAHAGVPMTWSGAPQPIAVEVSRTREPSARVRIAVASDSGVRLSLADSAGALDTLRGSSRGATLESPAAVGRVRASSGRFAASTSVPASVAPHAVLVLGRAGWESRFVAGALQESGWTVRSRQPVAPGVFIADADLLPIDTARYAAVVALDSTAADLAPAIARFVGQGGGLVLAGDTPALATLATLAPARTGAREPGRILLDGDSVTRADLPVRPLAAVRGDAVRLEGTPAAPTVAVRRAGLGRVITVGYDETWRWRMLGGEGGASAHREWWSHTVGLVAPALDAGVTPGDASPLASLVDVLGPPTSAAAAASADVARPALPLLLLVLLVALLLAETASRRFRGAR